MPTLDKLITDIGEYPGKEIFYERIAFLNEASSIYIHAQNFDEYVGISAIPLYETVINYFSDIKRLKDFHEIETTNLIKVASYTTYWFLKTKPIFLKKDPDKKVLQKYPILKYINENIAITILDSILFDRKELKLMMTEKLKQWNNFIKNLKYFFTYRVITPQSIELVLLSLVTDSPYEFKK